MGKQKVVIGISMKDQKARATAFRIAVGVSGVTSAFITAEKVQLFQLEVIGDFDVVVLACLLKRKVPRAQIVSVSPTENKADTPTPQTVTTTSFALPYPPISRFSPTR